MVKSYLKDPSKDKYDGYLKTAPPLPQKKQNKKQIRKKTNKTTNKTTNKQTKQKQQQ